MLADAGSGWGTREKDIDAVCEVWVKGSRDDK